MTAHSTDADAAEPLAAEAYSSTEAAASQVGVQSSQAVAERPSRPPGFDMTYQPDECRFGPTWWARLPSLVYLAVALLVGAVVLIGENSSTNTRFFDYVVVQDAGRVMSIRTLAIVLLVGAVSAVLRTGMRGIRVLPGGVETRDVTNFFMPKVRRYTWPQMERIILDSKRSIALDLWDGRRDYLPQVTNRPLLEATLERVAAARAIPVRGGRGLDEWVEPVSEAPPARSSADAE